MVNCLQHLAAAHATGELGTQGVYVISILHTSLPNNGRIAGGNRGGFIVWWDTRINALLAFMCWPCFLGQSGSWEAKATWWRGQNGVLRSEGQYTYAPRFAWQLAVVKSIPSGILLHPASCFCSFFCPSFSFFCWQLHLDCIQSFLNCRSYEGNSRTLTGWAKGRVKRNYNNEIRDTWPRLPPHDPLQLLHLWGKCDFRTFG